MRLDELGIDFSKGTFTDFEKETLKSFTKTLPAHSLCILLRAKFRLSRYCFILRREYTLHYIYTLVRQHLVDTRSIKSSSNLGIFLLVDNTIPLTSYTLGFVNSQYGDQTTGLLIFDVFMENTFGFKKK